jgi:hypothetical protein
VGKHEGKSATYVQAWLCEGEAFSGYVYDQGIALDKMAIGCDITSVTIVRHNNGDREYLKGTIAAEVYRYREAKTVTHGDISAFTANQSEACDD